MAHAAEPDASSHAHRFDRSQLIAALLVAGVTCVVYLPALRNGFVSWDDEKNFLQNAHYRGLGPQQLRWMWSTFHLGHYVPLSWMTLGFDYTLWGMNPAGYHLTNVLLHTGNAVLVYYLALRLLAASGVAAGASEEHQIITLAAAVAALAFALHPLRVESVAWITERRDVLCACFALGSTLAYLRHLDDTHRRRLWYGVALILFVASLLSKGTAVVLPLVFLLLNIYPLKRLSISSGWMSPRALAVYRELSPFVVLSAVASVMTMVALQHMDQLTPGAKIGVSAFSLGFYVWKTLLPFALSPLYAMPTRVDLAAVRFVVAYAVVIAVSWCAWHWRRRWPGAAATWIAFVVITLPMLGLVQNGPQIAADRYTYYAGPVIGVLAGAGFALWYGRRAAAAITTALALMVTLSVLTWRQIAVWHDSKALWAQVLRVDSTSAIALNNWGNLLAAENRLDDAIEYYVRAIGQSSTYADAHTNLAVALARQGHIADAMKELSQAIALDSTSDDAENDLGVTLVQQGRVQDAIAHYQRALTINPDNADAETNWGNALVRLGRQGEAIAHYRAALGARPDNPDAEQNWGVALAQQGRYAEAAEHFEHVLALWPNQADTRAYLDRANALARQAGAARSTPP